MSTLKPVLQSFDSLVDRVEKLIFKELLLAQFLLLVMAFWIFVGICGSVWGLVYIITGGPATLTDIAFYALSTIFFLGLTIVNMAIRRRVKKLCAD